MLGGDFLWELWLPRIMDRPFRALWGATAFAIFVGVGVRFVQDPPDLKSEAAAGWAQAVITAAAIGATGYFGFKVQDKQRRDAEAQRAAERLEQTRQAEAAQLRIAASAAYSTRHAARQYAEKPLKVLPPLLLVQLRGDLAMIENLDYGALRDERSLSLIQAVRVVILAQIGAFEVAEKKSGDVVRLEFFAGNSARAHTLRRRLLDAVERVSRGEAIATTKGLQAELSAAKDAAAAKFTSDNQPETFAPPPTRPAAG